MKKKEAKEVKEIPLLDLSTVDFDLCKRWPYEDNSVTEISCVHKLEYISGKFRVPVLEEAWRVLKPEGRLTVIVCYWTSPRAIQDPSLEWPPFSEQSFLYFNKGWREANLLPPIKCDFDFSYGYQVEQEASTRGSETQAFWIKHYTNTVNDLQLVLTKRS